MGRGGGMLLGIGGLVSKIFRGVAIRLQGGGCYSGTLRGSLCGIFESQVGLATPQRPPPPNSTYECM